MHVGRCRDSRTVPFPATRLMQTEEEEEEDDTPGPNLCPAGTFPTRAAKGKPSAPEFPFPPRSGC